MLATILTRAAARYGNKPALVTDTRTLTYTELDALSERVAAALATRGIAPGDRVSLYAQNRWEWIVAYHGILKAGAVVNPINVMLTPHEVRYVLGDCGARAIFCGPEKATAVLEAARDVRGVEHVISFGEAPEGALDFAALVADDVPSLGVSPAAPTALSTIGYTSGTTGHPKGAMQSHRAVFLNCALTATMHVRTERDVVVTALPAPHVYGNVVVNSTFMTGGTVVLMERFDPEGALDRIARHRATLFDGVPAMYMTMLAHPALGRFDLSSLTRCTVGGQTIAESVMRAWEERTGRPADRALGNDGAGGARDDACPLRAERARIDRRGAAGNRGACGCVRGRQTDHAGGRAGRVARARSDRDAGLLRQREGDDGND